MLGHPNPEKWRCAVCDVKIMFNYNLKSKIDKHKLGVFALAFRQDRWSWSRIRALPTDWVSRWQALPHTVGRVWGACRGALRLCVISKYLIRHAGHLALNP